MADSTAIQVIHDTIIINREIIIDSTRVVHHYDTLHKVSDLDILTKVNTMYDSAWTRLVVLIGLIGVGIPLFIQWYQTKQLKADREEVLNEIEGAKNSFKEDIAKAQKDLETEIENATQKLNNDFKKEMDETKEELTKDFEAQLKEKFDNADEKLMQIQFESDAHLHHLQGTINHDKENYVKAFFHQLKTCHYTLLANTQDYFNANIKNLTLVIKHLKNYNQIQEIETRAGVTIEQLITKVNTIDNNRWQEEINDLTTAIEELKNRSEKTESNNNKQD